MRSFLKVSAVLGAFLFCLGFTTIRATQDHVVRAARGGHAVDCSNAPDKSCIDTYKDQSTGSCGSECPVEWTDLTTGLRMCRDNGERLIAEPKSFGDLTPAPPGQPGKTNLTKHGKVACRTETKCNPVCQEKGSPPVLKCVWGTPTGIDWHYDWGEAPVNHPNGPSEDCVGDVSAP
jgi:hypothetical protein